MAVDGVAGRWMNHGFFPPLTIKTNFIMSKTKGNARPVPESDAERLGGDITEMN